MREDTIEVIRNSLQDSQYLLGLDLDSCNHATSGTPYFNSEEKRLMILKRKTRMTPITIEILKEEIEVLQNALEFHQDIVNDYDDWVATKQKPSSLNHTL